jgi:hypothetical protein
VQATTLADAVLARSEWSSVRAAIDFTLTELMRAVAHCIRSTATGPFFGLWGIDLALTRHRGAPVALLLETNPFPQLYRGHAALDAATDRMLADDVAPRLAACLAPPHHANSSAIVRASVSAAR